MALPTRITRYIIVLALTIIVFVLIRSSPSLQLWRDTSPITPKDDSILFQEMHSLTDDGTPEPPPDTRYDFRPGTAIAGHAYTRKIVLARKKKGISHVKWLDEQLPQIPRAEYIVDDPHASLRPPKNKGNEAMVYLSYIIDHYDTLPDVSIFIHGHRWAWHNNDLLEGDTALMIKHLSDARVIREGYMNLRCQWYPGCPRWLSPTATTEDEEKKEEMYVAQAWRELFPDRQMPEYLAQPCCSQFALSRERIRAVPKAEYERIRQWILDTRIKDSVSGRVFEYLWQYLFTGHYTLCPDIHVCYCDGYGACFATEQDFQAWFKMRFEVRKDEWELQSWQENEMKYEEFAAKGRRKDAERVQRAPEGRLEALKLSINQRWILLGQRREDALANGRDEGFRARIAGRVVDGHDQT